MYNETNTADNMHIEKQCDNKALRYHATPTFV